MLFWSRTNFRNIMYSSTSQQRTMPKLILGLVMYMTISVFKLAVDVENPMFFLLVYFLFFIFYFEQTLLKVFKIVLSYFPDTVGNEGTVYK